MSDLTILFYTANRIGAHFAEQVLHLLAGSLKEYSSTQPQPCVIVVSQGAIAPAWLSILGGRVINVGDQPPSIWQCYQNILAGAKAAPTPFIACCEDDSLYVPGHFNYRPPFDAFGYNHMRYVITRRLSDDGKRREAFYYFRERTQMAQCIAPRELLIETLEEKFAKFPEPVPDDVAKKTGWGEPGRYEHLQGLTLRKREYFRTAYPNVTFNHSNSLMGRRAVKETDVIAQSIEPWGEANALWKMVHGE